MLNPGFSVINIGDSGIPFRAVDQVAFCVEEFDPRNRLSGSVAVFDRGISLVACDDGIPRVVDIRLRNEQPARALHSVNAQVRAHVGGSAAEDQQQNCQHRDSNKKDMPFSHFEILPFSVFLFF